MSRAREEFIRDLVASSPPLTDEQIRELRALLPRPSAAVYAEVAAQIAAGQARQADEQGPGPDEEHDAYEPDDAA